MAASQQCYGEKEEEAHAIEGLRENCFCGPRI